MAIAYDNATSNGGTGTRSWTHTVVGTPRAVLVLAVANAATDVVTGVTYGGSALSEVALSPLLHTTGAEDGSLYGYFLGSSVPSGNQTCTVTVSGSPAVAAACITYTAAEDCSVDDTATLDSGGVANPSVTLDATTTVAVAGILHSGQNDVSGVTEGADYTMIAEADFGGQTTSAVRRTSNAGAGSVTVNWTATSEEAGILAVAVKENAAAVADVSPWSGGGFWY